MQGAGMPRRWRQQGKGQAMEASVTQSACLPPPSHVRACARGGTCRGDGTDDTLGVVYTFAPRASTRSDIASGTTCTPTARRMDGEMQQHAQRQHRRRRLGHGELN